MSIQPDDPEPYTIERDLEFTQLKVRTLEQEVAALTKGQEAILEPFLSLGHKQECPYYFTDKCNCKEKKKNE